MKRILYYLVPGIVVVFTFILSGCSSTQEPTGESPATVKSKVMTLSMEMVPKIESVVGTVISKNQANISPKVMGTIEAVYVKEGDTVKAGQALVKIDNRDLVPNVEKANAGLQEVTSGLAELDKAKDELIAAQQAAQANYDYASTSLHRMQNLYNRQAISKDMLDETVRQYKLAESNLATVSAKQAGLVDKRKQLLAKEKQVKSDLQLANVYLGYANIKSPISGLVVQKNMDPGSMASPGQTILVVESPNYQFEVAIKESLYPQLKLGNKVRVQLDSIQQTLDGTITEIVPASDPSSRTITVKINLPKTNHLRSGIYGKANFALGTASKLVIPKSAIVDRGSLTGVFAMDTANISRFQLIKTGDDYQDKVEITAGLEPGDQILLSNLENVQDGMKVEAE